MSDEQTVEPVKKRRGWPKGKPRKPPVEAIQPAPPAVEAPIHVRIRLKNWSEDIEFGCARREVVNGFHVFFYPSKRDPYRETRREFAVCEIIEIEITEARPVYDLRPVAIQPTMIPEPVEVPKSARPIIHSARRAATAALEALETSNGPVKMDHLPNLTFGDHMG